MAISPVAAVMAAAVMPRGGRTMLTAVPRLPSAAARTSRRLSMAVPRLPALGTPAHLEAVERRLRALYEGRHGASAYIGEPLTIASHSLLAAQLAHADGAPADVRLAALLHDIGHLLGLEAGRQPGMDGCGTAAHEAVGAAFVAALGFSESVSHLVGAHVDAKRYLCAVEPGYAATLSAASRTTLRHQGGPMSAAEARAAAARPSWPHVLAMRRWDEAAKDPAMRAAPFDAHIPLIRAHLAASAAAATGAQRQAACHAGGYVLSAEQLAQWDEAGALLLRGALPVGVEQSLGGMAEQVAGLRGVPGPWLVHLEAPEGRGARRPQLARVERFCDGLPAWATLCHAHAGSLCAQALREHVFLFKDKLNFKGPGGGGFLAHQDASAYATLASRHVSALVAIDAATEENGALQIAPGEHARGLLPNARGVLLPEVERALRFETALMQPGDVLLFCSYAPHRSGPNRSAGWRRSAYLTFSPAGEGDQREAYYAAKAEAVAAGAAGSISINDDFAGRVVPDWPDGAVEEGR